MASLAVFGANCATSHLRQLAKLDQAFGKGMPSHQRRTLFGAFNPARRISRVVDLSATHARGDERPSGLSTRHGWTFSTTVVATSLLVASPLVPLTSAFLTSLIPARANFSELRSSAPATHARCCSAIPNRFCAAPPDTRQDFHTGVPRTVVAEYHGFPSDKRCEWFGAFCRFGVIGKTEYGRLSASSSRLFVCCCCCCCWWWWWWWCR